MNETLVQKSDEAMAEISELIHAWYSQFENRVDISVSGIYSFAVFDSEGECIGGSYDVFPEDASKELVEVHADGVKNDFSE